MPGWGVAADLVDGAAVAVAPGASWLRGVAVTTGEFDSGTTVTTRCDLGDVLAVGDRGASSEHTDPEESAEHDEAAATEQQRGDN